MLAYLMTTSLLMPACPRTHHPSLCPRHTMPVTSGCKTPSISASEELGWGRGGHVPMKKAQKHPSASTQTIVPAFPHATSLHRRAKPGPFRGTTANPLLSQVDWQWGRHLGYSLCPGHWTSISPTACVYPSLANLQAGSGAQSILHSPWHLWNWDECLVPITCSPIAVGSCRLRSIPPLVPVFHYPRQGLQDPFLHPLTAGRARAPCWIFKFRNQPPGRIGK